jgi:hypothetical protein
VHASLSVPRAARESRQGRGRHANEQSWDVLGLIRDGGLGHAPEVDVDQAREV